MGYKTIPETDDCYYFVVLDCPTCEAENLVTGDTTMGGPYPAVLICHACGKRAWIGECAEADWGDDIDEAFAEIGLPMPKKGA